MIIVRNIPATVKLYRALSYLTRQRKAINAAKEQGDFEKEREYILKATSTWGKKVVEFFGVEVELQGAENLPAEGPVVFVSNHQGYADIPLLCSVLDTIQMGFIAKDGLEKLPLYGEWIKNIRSVLLKREEPREALKAIDEAIGLIHQGFSIMVFPEGSRSRSHEMNTFKKGSLRLATKPGVPVIPVTLDGTFKIFEEKGVVVPGKVKVMVHPAIQTAGLSRKEASNIAEIAEGVVRKGLDELRKRA